MPDSTMNAAIEAAYRAGFKAGIQAGESGDLVFIADEDAAIEKGWVEFSTRAAD